MKQAGFKKKKVKVQSVPANEEEREEEFKSAILELDNKLDKIYQEKGHIVYLDECVFKSRDFKRQAWSSPHDSILVKDRVQN